MSSPYRGVTVGCDPHTSEIIGIDFVLYKLSPPFLVDVDASCLSVMDLTAHHCGVGVGLHLKACYTVSMDVTVLKVTLKHRRGHVPSAISQSDTAKWFGNKKYIYIF